MKKQILIMALMLLVGISLFGSDNIYKADSKQINYVGRTEQLADGSVTFDWVGVYFRTRFTGNNFSLKVSDTKSSFFHVFVDGKFVKDINTKGTEKIIDLCSGIDGGVHTIQVFKRTEGSEGMTTIHQIILSEGAKLLPWLDFPKRKIEFIGNSITCGFGVETTNPHEEYTIETENAYYSYASVTARYLDADYTLIAHSGQGVVRNYGDEKRISDYTMRQRFYALHDMNKDKQWDFTRWQPDVVVINLGTNDFSQDKRPTDKEFIAGYKELVQSVRKAYGSAIPILCLSSPMSIDLQRECIDTARKELNDNNLYFVPMYKYLMNNPQDMGMSFHPNRIGQRKIAMVLSAYMSSIMGWELTEKTIK